MGVRVTTRFYSDRLYAAIDSLAEPDLRRRTNAVLRRAIDTAPVFQGDRWGGPASGRAGTLRDSHRLFRSSARRFRVINTAPHAALIHFGSDWVAGNSTGHHEARPWLADALAAGK